VADALHADPAGLIRRCLARDDAARAEFIAAYDVLIRRAIARRVQRTVSAQANLAYVDDIANEVYLRLFANDCRVLASVQEARSLTAWLVTVSQNQAITFLRKMGVSHLPEESAVKEETAPYDQAPDAQAISNERFAQVAKGLGQLPAQDQIILRMFYIHGRRYSDIAEAMGMNINTVASRIKRAKQKLKDAIEEGET